MLYATSHYFNTISHTDPIPQSNALSPSTRFLNFSLHFTSLHLNLNFQSCFPPRLKLSLQRNSSLPTQFLTSNSNPHLILISNFIPNLTHQSTPPLPQIPSPFAIQYPPSRSISPLNKRRYPISIPDSNHPLQSRLSLRFRFIISSSTLPGLISSFSIKPPHLFSSPPLSFHLPSSFPLDHVYTTQHDGHECAVLIDWKMQSSSFISLSVKTPDGQPIANQRTWTRHLCAHV